MAAPEDVSGILALQDPNVIGRGGTLSVRPTADKIRQLMSGAAMSYVLIIQAMLSRFPLPADCYLYGHVCIDTTERGKGLAGRLFEALRVRLPAAPQ